MPRDLTWASSRAATSDSVDEPDTVASLYTTNHCDRFASRTSWGHLDRGAGARLGPPPERAAEHRSGPDRNQGRIARCGDGFRGRSTATARDSWFSDGERGRDPGSRRLSG